MDTIIIAKKNWESQFFDKNFYELKISSDDAPLDKVKGKIVELLESSNFDLIECNLSCNLIKSAIILEDIGFRLIDSRIQFITKKCYHKEQFYTNDFKDDYEIGLAKKEDADPIKELTRQYISNNTKVVSRYKNQRYFETNDAEKYFSTWIDYSISKDNSLVAVAKRQGSVTGFFIYENKGVYKDSILYKGVLCAVDKLHQGKKLHLLLQSYLFEYFNQRAFYIDNTTQLSNYPVIKNHIRSQRDLYDLSLTYFLRRNDFRKVLPNSNE